MKKLTLAILIFMLTSPTWATTYFVAPASSGGSDSNNGTTVSTPWLSPNHSVNCGDVIIAAASTAYDYTNFAAGKWGTVTCTAGNNVAWLKCATFDACKITVPPGSGTFASALVVSNSYWGVQGFENSTASNTDQCFQAYPSNGVTIHHIIFANDIANQCGQAGFGSSPNGSAGVDYFVVVGDIAYNAAQASYLCGSGIYAYEPVASDTLSGTHIYFAGNFSFDNLEPSTCDGGPPTDGEGFILDTVDGSGTGLSAYTQQIVIDNNISIYNGGRGILPLHNLNGTTQAPIYVRHNTTYGNEMDPNQISQVACSEITLYATLNTSVFLNLTESTAATGCDGNTIYNYYVLYGNGTVRVYNNYGYNSLGNNTASNGGGFSFGPNNTFGNPGFANPTNPGAPSCSSFSSVPACMAALIANFSPGAPSAVGYGYLVPNPGQTYDPLFPQWLCNVNLPAGLVTMGCLALSSLPATVTITRVTVQ